MIDKTHQLSVRQQSQLIQINRSTLYYKPKEISSTDLSLMRLIDEIHLDYPFIEQSNDTRYATASRASNRSA